jgi:CelD/BcsL family acetyltransferase involved in cellulose biosynthesis
MQVATQILGSNMPVTVNVVAPSELTHADKAAWSEIRASNPALYSPYFHSGYTDLIGALRNDAYVAVVSRAGIPIAFLPFQGPRKGKSGFARPIGAPMTDYHGFICAPDANLDIVGILQEAGIGAFHYSANIDPDNQFAASAKDQAAVMDLSVGADAWRAARDGSYKRHLKSHRRRVRKAEEEFGPRRFEYKCTDPAVFDQLITWKREKFADTGKYDVLSSEWTLTLLKQLWKHEGVLRCDMQALYFGERLAAVDLGLTDGETFHSWIVAYDGELHSFAPGIQLLEGLIDAAADQVYKRIDLGAGLDGYKRHYGTEAIMVGSGFMAAKGPAATLSQIYDRAEQLGKKTLKDAPGKLRRRYSQIAACDDSFSGRAKAMISAVKTSSRS